MRSPYSRLYGDLKVNGSVAQRTFLDRFLLGRDQARTLGEQMGTLLDDLPSDPNARDSARDQIIAAVALAKLGVTPAAVINHCSWRHTELGKCHSRYDLIPR